AKDTFSSTTIRSVLSEIYAADKTVVDKKVNNSTVISIVRKAVVRRNDSARQYIAASRTDLAETETREADLLSTFLPPLKSEAEVDSILRDIISQQNLKDVNPHKRKGELLKAFYSKVDKSLVDGDMVQHRAKEHLANSP
ncbi:GatB/YqeY domain-containing protein, partial [Rickenella mellea]